MFNDEENDLFQDMKSLPHEAIMSKLNHIGKRAKTAIVRNKHIILFYLTIIKILSYCKLCYDSILGTCIYNQ